MSIESVPEITPEVVAQLLMPQEVAGTFELQGDTEVYAWLDVEDRVGAKFTMNVEIDWAPGQRSEATLFDVYVVPAGTPLVQVIKGSES